VALEELVLFKRRYEGLRLYSLPWSPDRGSAEGVFCIEKQKSYENLEPARGHKSNIRRGSHHSGMPSPIGGPRELLDSTVQTLSALAENSVHQQTEMQELLKLQKLRDDSQSQLEDQLQCALQRQRQLEDELKIQNQGHMNCDKEAAYRALSQHDVNTQEEKPKSHAGTQTYRDESHQSSNRDTEEDMYSHAKDNHVVSDLIGNARTSAMEECRHLKEHMADMQSAVYFLSLLVFGLANKGKSPTRMRPGCTCCSARQVPPIEVRTCKLMFTKR
jgi:hypothetical protein